MSLTYVTLRILNTEWSIMSLTNINYENNVGWEKIIKLETHRVGVFSSTWVYGWFVWNLSSFIIDFHFHRKFLNKIKCHLLQTSSPMNCLNNEEWRVRLSQQSKKEPTCKYMCINENSYSQIQTHTRILPSLNFSFSLSLDSHTMYIS